MRTSTSMPARCAATYHHVLIDTCYCGNAHVIIILLKYARGIVGRVTDSGVKGLGFKSRLDSNFYRTETSSL